jgi:sensor histidine kinase YesM
MPRLMGAVQIAPYGWPQMAALVVVLVAVFEFRHRALASVGALMRAQIDDVAADARLRDARLRMLQAQLAPHFLFNTLANVRRLAQTDRREAASMLGDLVEYFSVTLSRRDDPWSTLGDEARLVDAYLRIHRIRMGARLAYAIEVPEDLGPAHVPSMILLTLVENAVKHGINPLAEGGFVRMRGERRGDTLRIEVADNGRGLTLTEGHGMGLANIRARLSMLYGDRADLALQPGEPRGLVASVLLPFSAEP